MTSSTIEKLLEAIAAYQDAVAMLKQKDGYLSKAKEDRARAFAEAWEAFDHSRTGFVACRDGQILEFVRAGAERGLRRSALVVPSLTDEAWEALPDSLRQLKVVCSSFLVAEEREGVAEACYNGAATLVVVAKARLQCLMEAVGEGQYLCGDRVLTIDQRDEEHGGEYEGRLSAIL